MRLQVGAGKYTWGLRQGVNQILCTSIGIANGYRIGSHGKVEEVLLGSSGIPKEGVGLGTTTHIQGNGPRGVTIARNIVKGRDNIERRIGLRNHLT